MVRADGRLPLSRDSSGHQLSMRSVLERLGSFGLERDVSELARVLFGPAESNK